jgi:hypothetical protein
MRPLSAAELLTAWEDGLADTPWGRALSLLVAACPESSREEIATLSIGERDGRLFTLREWAFGSQLASVTHCVSCGDRVEWTIDVADLRSAGQAGESGDLSLEVDGWYVNFRLPNTHDVAAASQYRSPAEAQQALLELSIREARLGDREIAVSALPAEVVEAVARRMAEADPQSEVQLELTCPACGKRWPALFDIGSFFWSEINAWAQRLLTEVHALARAYGWREAEIINLSPWRRQFYLNLVSG